MKTSIMKYILLAIPVFIFCMNCQKKSNEEQMEIVMPSIETITYDDISFTICTLNPNDFELKMASHVEDDIDRIKELGDSLYNIDKQLLFATNGGIFSKEYLPGGLFINNGKLINELNEREGAGNFHLMPNGAFCLGKDNIPFVAETKRMKEKDMNEIELGIQSGPMLVIENEIHPAFRDGSKNIHFRNGVGVNSKGEIIFVISNQRTNFYSFASLFRDKLDCQNALYLDGFISEMYIHGQSKSSDIKRKFATIFYLEGNLVK